MTAKTALFTLLLTLLPSCGTLHKLDDSGKKVQIYHSYLDAPSLQKYRSKLITCTQEVNVRSKQTNIISCTNYIRNEAGKLGATFVVVDRNQQLLSGSGGCNNCVMLKGDAYVRKPRKKR